MIQNYPLAYNQVLDAEKIAVIGRIDLFKTSEQFIYDQALALRGWTPVLAGTPVGQRPEWCDSLPVIAPRDIRRLRADLPNRPMVLHAHFGVDGVAFLRHANAADIPLLVTLHGFDITRTTRSYLLSGRPHLLRYALERHRLRTNRVRFLAVSAFIRERAIHNGINPSRVETHHIGIPIPAWSQPESRKRSTDTLRIAFIGRLVEKKGVSILLDALALLPVGSVHLDIVGDGPQAGSINAQIASLGAQQYVTRWGELNHDRAMQVLSGADVLCLPSRVARNGDAEGLGMVLLEAAARGVAILGSQSGGIGDFLRDGDTGLAVPPNDPSSLAEAIRQLFDPALRSRLTAQSRQLLITEFDIVKQTRDLERIYSRTHADFSRPSMSARSSHLRRARGAGESLTQDS